MDVGQSTDLFRPAEYVQSSFSAIFPRTQAIAEYGSGLETFVGANYFPAQKIPIPPEIDPEFPRLVLSSQHGFSQIVITQINAALTVNYSPDWSIDIDKGHEYVVERVQLLFEWIASINLPVLYCGITTVARLQSDDESGMLGHLASYLDPKLSRIAPIDTQLRITTVVEDRFFSNVTIQNYRNWPQTSSNAGVLRQSRSNARAWGAEVVVDFNDRYAFNELDGYQSSPETAVAIISKGTQTTKDFVRQIQEGFDD